MLGRTLAAAAMAFGVWSFGLAGSAEAASQFCTFEYRTVCAAERRGAPKTYGNACQARADRARILYAGECRRGCTREFRPVCARVPGRRPATFPNACVARHNGARLIHSGACAR